MTPPPLGADLVRRTIALASTLVAAILVSAGAVLGASATPSGGPREPYIEAWLDHPIPADVAAGDTYSLGVTLWGTAEHGFAEFSEAYVRLHPAAGSAKPSSGTVRSDWPGHVTAEIVVPPGGAGEIEVGVVAQVCTVTASAQTCAGRRLPVAIAGIGPPPDAPRSMLVDARFETIPAVAVANEPIEITIVVEPHVDWDAGALGLPDRIVVIANERSGRGSTSADLPRAADHPSDGTVAYTGPITIAAQGEVTLQAAIPGNGTEDQVIRGAATRLVVGASGSGPGPAATGVPDGGSAQGLPWPAIAVVVLALAAAIVARRVFADL